ncbi:MAG: hypothetical protein Q7R50_01090 [Dehalococcoidales bacterium]|nr:hypothetical protein [Dehalococcoidales bacterium]
MGKRYFIELSRKDVGLVSYFPGLEIKDDPDDHWIDGVLTAAVAPLAKRRSVKIWNTPITFWCCVRETARRRAEIFVFVTPAFPGVVIERALCKTLEPLRDGKVNAGREPIPEYAFPCLQIFRGSIIRFYTRLEGQDGFYVPTIQWSDNKPSFNVLRFSEDDEFLRVDVPIEQMGRFFAEARLSSVSDGEYCRKFQQAFSIVASEAE